MSRKARKLSPHGYYHIVIRGISRQILFEEDNDYKFFLKILGEVIQKEAFEIHAYCLMSNHVHLLLKADSNLGRIMKRITVSYAHYFNEKYERTGPLFQGRFGSEPITDDRYFLTVVRYIHNNPQKAGICRREKYRWSSWNAYVGDSGFVTTDLVINMMGGKEGFQALCTSEDEEECLDIKEMVRISDRMAQQIIKEEFHVESGTQLQTENRAERDAALRLLKSKGLSVRQIERLTGINRGVVLRA